jgi:hypothetical protein
MTGEQLKRAVELDRSLKQLKLILSRLQGKCKDDVWYFSSLSLTEDGLKMPDILRTEFIIAVKDCIRRTEEEIKEL